jgi:hypothetical protein
VFPSTPQEAHATRRSEKPSAAALTLCWTPRLRDSEGLLSFVRASRTQSSALMGQRQLSGHSHIGLHYFAIASDGARVAVNEAHTHPVAPNKRHTRAFLAYERAHKVAPARGGPLPPCLCFHHQRYTRRASTVYAHSASSRSQILSSRGSREGQGRGTRASLAPACTLLPVNCSGCTARARAWALPLACVRVRKQLTCELSLFGVCCEVPFTTGCSCKRKAAGGMCTHHM